MNNPDYTEAVSTSKVGFRKLPDGRFLYHPFSEYVSHAIVLPSSVAEKVWGRHDRFGKLALILGVLIYPLASFSSFLISFAGLGVCFLVCLFFVYIADSRDMKGCPRVEGNTTQFGAVLRDTSAHLGLKDFVVLYVFFSLMVYASVSATGNAISGGETSDIALSVLFSCAAIFIGASALMLSWARLKGKAKGDNGRRHNKNA